MEHISIHALREEGDKLTALLAEKTEKFQSTPSARRATRAGSVRGMAVNLFQSTPSARRATSKSGEKIRHVCSIIHTCAQFEKELYEGSGEMQNKSC